MATYKFDRSAFKARSFREADAANVFDKQTPYPERLRQAYFLIAQAYGFSGQKEPKLDRTYFTSRKLNK